jgi:hypothetical protein
MKTPSSGKRRGCTRIAVHVQLPALPCSASGRYSTATLSVSLESTYEALWASVVPQRAPLRVLSLVKPKCQNRLNAMALRILVAPYVQAVSCNI